MVKYGLGGRVFPRQIMWSQQHVQILFLVASLNVLGRLNCRLCRLACIRWAVSVIGRCLVRHSTGTWGVPVGLSWFCSLVSRLGNEHFLLNPFRALDADIAAWCSAVWWFSFVSRGPVPKVQVLPSFGVFRTINFSSVALWNVATLHCLHWTRSTGVIIQWQLKTSKEARDWLSYLSYRVKLREKLERV
jgi:hypothetical protein